MASHIEVAHRWAQDIGRPIQGFRMFFEAKGYAEGDQPIFSHGRHFTIANIVSTPSGERVILFTTKDHSISTSKHKSIVSRAIPRGRFRVFYVENPHKGYEVENLDAAMQAAAKLYAKAKRARLHGAFHLERAREILEGAKAYAAAFNVQWEAPDLEALTAAVEAREKEQGVYDAAPSAEAVSVTGDH